MKKTIEIGQEELAAIEVLRGTGVDVIDAALLAKEVLSVGRGRLKRARACIAAGDEMLRMREKTVTFERAVEVALAERKDRRKRTVTDFRYLTRRMMRKCKGLAKRRVRSITARECMAYLREAFDTPRQRNKARLILSGVFATAFRHEWCAENPVRKVQPERIIEKRIQILKSDEINRLLHTASVYRGGKCLPAVGMMLYAGIRPQELTRLCWGDVRLPASDAEAPCDKVMGVICIAPQHSKTGGARRVTIQPPLAHILSRAQKEAHESICPKNWQRHWTAIHRAAGFEPWQPDVLRHTFATHHLATHRSYAELQLEMGHRSAELLRTRYVAMEGIYHRGESILAG